MHEESNGATDPFNALCKTIHWTSAVKSTLYTPMEHASDNIIFMVHCAKTGHLDRQKSLQDPPSGFQLPIIWRECIFFLVFAEYLHWFSTFTSHEKELKTSLESENSKLEGPSEDHMTQFFVGKGSLYEIIQYPVQSHLGNLQWRGLYHIPEEGCSSEWLFLLKKNSFLCWDECP